VNRLVGVALVVVSAATFGSLAIFGRLAYAAGLDTATLLFLRFGFSAVLMVGWLALRGERLPEGRTLGWLAGMGAIGYVGQSFSYLTAIQYASAGLVGLLLYLYPTFVAILAVVFLKARLTRVKVAALVMATAGAAMTANPQGGQWNGILLAILAAVIYAVYIVVGARVLEKASAAQSSTVIFAAAGLVYGGLAATQGPQWPTTPGGWWVIAGIVVVATVIPVTTFLGGLKRIGPTDASLLSTLEPVVTVLLAAAVLGERLQLISLVGGGLILGAAVMLTRAEMRGGNR
jgi:drug/metabolite transporter (DMT)-like permease